MRYNPYHVLRKEKVPFIIDTAVKRLKETLFQRALIKQESHYETSEQCDKSLLRQKLVYSEHCQDKRSHGVLISVHGHQHKVFKEQWLCTP